MRHVLAVVLGLNFCGALAVEPEDLRGLPLEQALEALRADGLAIIYSSDLVRPWMRVLSAPVSDEPSEMLTEILAPVGLAVRAGPSGIALVVRGSGPAVTETGIRSGSAPATPETGPSPDAAAPVPIEEIVVAGSRYQLARAVGDSMFRLWSENIEYLPDLGDDALRSIARLPGIGTDSVSARSNVRGGETRETIVRFDGLRLHDPFHLKDFNSVFSAIDPRLVASMDVFTGGFPAALGDSLSGVVDVVSMTPPAPLYHEVSFSFFNTSALSSGRFDKGSWVGSVRRSTLDLFHESSETYVGRPVYLDAYAKLVYRLSDRLQLTGNFLQLRDDIQVTHPNGEQQVHALGEDSYLWLRFDHDPGPAWTGTTLVARTRLRNRRNGFSRLAGIGSGWLDDRRNSSLDTVQSDWSATLGDGILLQVGGMLSHTQGRYRYADEVAFDVLVDFPGAPDAPARARDIHLNPDGSQSALYGSVRYASSDRLAMEAGLRWDRETLSPDRASVLAPRIGLRYRLADRLYVKGSLGRFYQSQAIYEVQLEDGVERYFPPQRADHAVVGLEREFRSGLGLRVEAYSKAMKDLRPRYENLLNPLMMFPELKPDRIRIAPEKANARGFEVFLEQQTGDALSWWIGYSRSRFTDRIDGRSHPRSWDRTHVLSAGLNWDAPRWNIGLGFLRHSGWPITPVALGADGYIAAVNERNSERVAHYSSTDLRITRKFRFPRSSGSVFVEWTNAFDRSNPYSREYALTRGNGGDELLLDTLHTLPRLPSLGFVWTF